MPRLPALPATLHAVQGRERAHPAGPRAVPFRPRGLRARCLATLTAVALACGAAQALDLQGHRGARGLMPENTLPAFERALEIGVTTLELDIGVSADGVVVVSHDPYLNPLITRDAQGQWLAGDKGPLLKSLTLAQIQGYELGRIRPGSPYAATFSTQEARDGTRMPTLAALFDRVKALGADHVAFNIETKIHPAAPEDTVGPEPMTQALLKVIRDAGMTRRVTLQSFDWRTLAIARKLEPAIPIVCLTLQTPTSDNLRDGQWTAGLKWSDHGSAPRMVKAFGCDVWSPNGGAVTQALVDEARALGLKTVPWTINAPADMDRFIGWGVDGLISDYPDRLREAAARRGLPLPPPVAVRR